MAFDKKLLDILACPVCKGKLLYQNKQAQLICKKATNVVCGRFLLL
jgi:uncharacterized protein YbaR (Trm112 family)